MPVLLQKDSKSAPLQLNSRHASQYCYSRTASMFVSGVLLSSWVCRSHNMYGSDCNASWTASMHITMVAANISVRPSLCSWKQHQSNIFVGRLRLEGPDDDIGRPDRHL